jgi:integrase/recombinase XerD
MALTADIFWGTGYLGELPRVVVEGGEGRKGLEGKSGRARRVLDGLLEGLRASDLPGTEYAEQYLRHLYRRNRRPNTLRTNCAAVKSLLAFVQGRGKTHLEMITREDLEALVEHEQDRGLSPGSILTQVTHVRSYLRFLTEAQVVRAEVLSRPMRIKVPEALPRAMDPQDVSRLLGVIDHVRDRAMVLVLLRTGMRIGELLETKVQDVELSERRILIWEAQKNRVGRVVYLSDDAREALTGWLGSREAHKEVLFYGKGRETMSYTAARMRFQGCLEKAGLMHKGYSLHSLRHTFATGLLNAGMRIECLQQLLGHSNLEITRRYARLSDRTREEEYFKAMAVIERGPSDGRYQLDRELQAALEEEELLSPHGQDVPACH